eukprot:jgi/Psemu1/59685/gm1.59685_g
MNHPHHHNQQQRSLPVSSLRSPLARLNENREDTVSQYSASGGRTTRAVSRKLRQLFDNDNENGISDAENEGNNNCCRTEPNRPSLNVFFATAENSSKETCSTNADPGSTNQIPSDPTQNDVFMMNSHTAIASTTATANATATATATTTATTTATATTTTTTKKKFKSKPTKRTSIGRWETWERFEFLRGLRKHGRGHWKKIGESIPTRSTVQVKTHAQVMLKKQEQGTNIFEDLDNHERHILSALGTVKAVLKSFHPNQEVATQRRRSSLPLPMTKGTKKHSSSRSNEEQPRRERNKSMISHCHQHRHSFPLSNKTEQEFRAETSLPLEISPTPFPPMTTTTVTTTTSVGNSNHHHHHHPHHPFHRGHYDTHRHPHHFYRHPYRYTPSFEAIAALTGAASSSSSSSSSSSIFLPSQSQQQQRRHNMLQDRTTSSVAQQQPMTNRRFDYSTLPNENGIKTEVAVCRKDRNQSKTSNLRRNAVGKKLVLAEVHAVEALLGIRGSEGDAASFRGCSGSRMSI